MDDLTPTAREYAIAFGLLVGLAVGAAFLVGPSLVLLAAVGASVLAVVPGVLFRSHGYTFVEGWAAGLLVWPLAVAFGLWGPRRDLS